MVCNMIKELCLMDLLEQEKNAVENYNCAISCIGDSVKFCYEMSLKEPDKKDAIERYYEKNLSCQLKKKIKAEEEIKNAREKIKKYFSRS